MKQSYLSYIKAIVLIFFLLSFVTLWTETTKQLEATATSVTFNQQKSSYFRSLWESVAPVAFQVGEDGFILLPDKVRTVVIDVGARDSDYLSRMESSKDPSVALILVDPLPDSMIPLIQRATTYTMLGNDGRWLEPEKLQVFTVKAALGPEESITNFNVALGPACGSLLERNNASDFWCTEVKQKIKVIVLTLEGLLKLIPPQVESFHLKVDAEGADLMVLQGAKESIRRFQTVVIECSDDTDESTKLYHVGECRLSEAREYMNSHGFHTESTAQGGLINIFFFNRNISTPLPDFLASPFSSLTFRDWYTKKAKQLNKTV